MECSYLPHFLSPSLSFLCHLIPPPLPPSLPPSLPSPHHSLHGSDSVAGTGTAEERGTCVCVIVPFLTQLTAVPPSVVGAALQEEDHTPNFIISLNDTRSQAPLGFPPLAWERSETETNLYFIHTLNCAMPLCKLREGAWLNLPAKIRST